MGSSFNITVRDNDGFYNAKLVKTSVDSKSPNSLSLGGRHYEIQAADDKLSKVLDILTTLYPEAVNSTSTLSGRVTHVKDAGVNSIFQRVSEAAATGEAISALKKTDTNAWVKTDQAYLRLIAQAYIDKVKRKATDPAGLKGFLLYGAYETSSIEDLDQKFDEAIAQEDVELFLPLLDHACEEDLTLIIDIEKLDIPIRQNESLNNFIFTEESLKALDSYVHDPAVGFSGVITLQDATGTPHTIASEGIAPTTPFAMHSISKVFTGMLAIKLIQKGEIPEEVMNEPIQLAQSVLDRLPEEVMNEPIQLAQSVLDRLPEEVQRHLSEKKPKLRQVMLHQGGLGDYVGKEIAAITQAVLSGTEPPKMKKPEDLLSFAENKTFPLGEEHYSNLGFLLVGLSLQHLTGKSFDDLLRTHVITPAGISSFSSQKPDGARVNPLDPTAKYIGASPAGGYWTTAEDLCKFGSWITSQYKDPVTGAGFKNLVKKYGGEFYSEGEINHSGGIESASAYLSVLPEQGVVISILSDKKSPSAKRMNDAIRTHMLHQA